MREEGQYLVVEKVIIAGEGFALSRAGVSCFLGRIPSLRWPGTHQAWWGVPHFSKHPIYQAFKNRHQSINFYQTSYQNFIKTFIKLSSNFQPTLSNYSKCFIKIYQTIYKTFNSFFQNHLNFISYTHTNLI